MPFWKRYVTITLVLIAAMLPAVVVSLLWVPGVRGIAVFGLLVASGATLMRDWRLGVTLSLMLSVAGTLAVLSNDLPGLGALLIVTLAAAAGFAALRGLHIPPS